MKNAPVVVALAMAGCATTGLQGPGNFVQQTSAPPAEVQAAPLLNENGGFVTGGGSLFAGRRAHRVGDLITIRLAHNVSADASADTTLSRQSDISAGLSAMVGLENALADIGLTPSALVGAQATNDFDGQGGTKRSGALSGTITAQVVQVLPNGHLQIGGRQAVKINNEVEVLALSGIVDPRSIDGNNVVSSSAIADARVEYTGMGVVAGKQRPGWLTRVLDVVAPF